MDTRDTNDDTHDIIDFMLDIETLGLNPCPVIIQISVVAFIKESGKILGDPFDRRVNAHSCVSTSKQFKIDGETIEWWMKQEESIYEDIFLNAMRPTNDKNTDIKNVLNDLSKWLTEKKRKYCRIRANTYGDGRSYIWANGGANTDCTWLNQAYKACGIQVPFSFTEIQDVRTLVNQATQLTNTNPKQETILINPKKRHHALEDCYIQITYCHQAYNLLKNHNKREKELTLKDERNNKPE